MQVTVSYLGLPVVACDARVARTPVGAVAMGLGARLSGYAAYRAGGAAGAEALELHDAHGASIPSAAVRLASMPFRRVGVFVHFRHAVAAVPARIQPAGRGAGAAARPRSR